MTDKFLVIAEKPSVAADIAKALGGLKRQKDYFEGDRYIVTSALGHLLELSVADKYEVKRGKWSFAHLPMIPPEFTLTPIKASESRLKLIKSLIKREDVSCLINACDAGREGELIFRYIVQSCRTKKPSKRLWLQSMTLGAITQAFENLKTDEQMRNLADAARSRSEADWLVGINATRAMTAFNSKDGGFFLTTVGRVQTPTLAIVVKREEERSRFVSRPYFEVQATFDSPAGTYEGLWFDAKAPKGDVEEKPERLFEESRAREIVELCRDKPAAASDTKKRTSSFSPALFDLTSLQREANSRFGLSAKTTLQIAQALYEKHKALTYPRTDSRALPEDYLQTVRETLSRLKTTALGAHAARILDNGWVKPNRRIFDNSKISDHFAIIPTMQVPSKLNELEEKIYNLVLKRFLAVFFPAAVFDVTTRITIVQEQSFKSEGKILVEAGWLAVYDRDADDAPHLPPLADEQDLRVKAIACLEKATKAPPRYNEATLLAAMEGAGKLVEDETLRFLMKGKGLGTPATRAAVIEGLITQNYIYRDGKDLVPTVKARQLMALLKGLGEKVLCDPELTGQWEFKLAQMERGELSREAFMQDIRNLTQEIVESAKRYEGDTVPIENPARLSVPCPKCGGEIVENYRRFACTKCDFSLTKIPAGRTLEAKEVESLIRDREVGPLSGFISKTGRPFAGKLLLTDDLRMAFDFDKPKQSEEQSEEPTGEPLGACPKCGGRIFAAGSAYRCENGAQKKCDFRMGRTILSRDVTPEEVRELLANKRTGVLEGFVSKRTGKPFSARLVLSDSGDVGFGFEDDGKPRRTYRRKSARS